MCTGLEIPLIAGLAASTIQTGATVAGVALGAGGLAASVYGQKQASEGSKKAEGLRKQQMELNHMREQRQIFRQAQNARAVAASNAAQGGTMQSSGLAGGYGQIAGAAGAGITASNENLDIGRGLFDANAQKAEGQGIAAIGSATSAFGKDLISVGPELGRIGSTYMGGKRRAGDFPRDSGEEISGYDMFQGLA